MDGGLLRRKRDTISNNKSPKSNQKNDQRGKRSKRSVADEAEEARLTARIFGGGGGGNSRSALAPAAPEEEEDPVEPWDDGINDDDNDDENDDDGVLFAIDRTGETVPAHEQQHDDEDDDENDEEGDSRQLALAATNKKKKGHDGDRPAWVDEDDTAMKVNLLETSRLRRLRKSRTEEAASALSGAELERRMREEYQQTTGRTARTDWADLHHNNDTNDAEEKEEEGAVEPSKSNDKRNLLLLQGTSQSLLRHAGQRRLEPNKLDIVRCPNANLADPCRAVARVVQFHPGANSNNTDSPLLLTAGFDKTLRFFQVGSEGSKKIHGVHFPNFPIYSASFLGDTGNVIVSSRRRFFYIYNAAAGKLDRIDRIVGREEKSLELCVASPDGRTVAFAGNDGFVILYDTHHKQWIANVKLNGNVRAMTFAPSSGGDTNTHHLYDLLATGSDGDVYRWDMRTHKCLERFANQDGTACSFLAASERHVAVGSKSGVVNLYNADSSNDENGTTAEEEEGCARTPLKSILNLQTSITSTRFNHDGQVLAMSTNKENRHGLKLLHVPTATVFANWPTMSTPLGYVWSMDFSPDSQFLALGNDKGNCLLYQLKHYCSS